MEQALVVLDSMGGFRRWEHVVCFRCVISARLSSKKAGRTEHSAINKLHRLSFQSFAHNAVRTPSTYIFSVCIQNEKRMQFRNFLLEAVYTVKYHVLIFAGLPS
jgi:hypothetical protein